MKVIKCKNDCPEKKFNGCCVQCPERESCSEVCEQAANYEDCPDAINEETALTDFKTQQLATIQKIAEICTTKKQLEAQEAEMKKQLKEAMEKYGITNFENELLKISYISQGVRKSIDSTKLKKELPDVAEKYTKSSVTSSSYIKIEVKDNG